MTNTIINIICMLPSVILAFGIHEFAHAKVADKLGDPTPRMMGRVTLDPFAHIDILGLLMLMIAGFGWGKPVQINPSNFRKPRRDMLLVSAAGPMANLTMALVCGTILALVMRFVPVAGNEGFWRVFSPVFTPFVTWNTLLFAFNVIPIPPLDGYKVVRALAKHPSSKFFRFMDSYGFVLLMLLFITGGSSYLIGWISSIVRVPMTTLFQMIL
nr:site-2 protease family protein [Maliibacterium massiliense]